MESARRFDGGRQTGDKTKEARPKSRLFHFRVSEDYGFFLPAAAMLSAFLALSAFMVESIL
jgi:hypothetical protein